jgi:serine/threonine-protein kinase RsbT
MNGTRVIASEQLVIAREEDIASVRRRVRDLATQHGFDPFAGAALTTATSELARNTWVHGGGGTVEVEQLLSGGTAGLRLSFRDQGPGIADMESALAGGKSSIRSLGLGLSGSRRLVDEFSVRSAPGQGTEVVIIKWRRR